MICIILLPIVALLPDLSFSLLQRIFFPTPTDAVMRIQKQNPKYVYDGFRDVYIPGLPDDDALEEAARIKFMREQELKKEIEAQEREDHRLFDE
jgi:hypothetical protein